MASIHASTEPEANRAFGARRLGRAGLLALVAACLVNLGILYASVALIEFPSAFVGGPFGPLAVGPVVVNSVVAAIGATVVYGVTVRYSARPNRTFVMIAGGALVLSFAMFLAPDLSGAPSAVFAVLSVMHVAAAIVIVRVLVRATTAEVAGR